MENIESGITKYRMFELKKNSKLKVLITYVNNNEIVEIKKQKVELKYKNYLSKEELAIYCLASSTVSNTKLSTV